ncbi:hypothetical protein BH11ARM2_BH11ARM2_28990 [soil metagenome]
MCGVATGFVETLPMSDYLWTSVLTLCVLGYLVYALLKPEKF